MEVILLERVAKLGQMGDVVRVKAGYARNFLLPAGKALRATADNQKVFENRRSELEARNLELRKEAESVAEKLSGRNFIIIRSASGTGSLYGSVSARDIWQAAEEDGVCLLRQQIQLVRPIKELGMHDVAIELHPEVEVSVNVNVARSTEEASLQAQGLSVSSSVDADDEEETEMDAAEDTADENAAEDGESEDRVETSDSTEPAEHDEEVQPKA